MSDNDQETARHVTGIGGVFFRSQDPAALSAWYERYFKINPPPQAEGHLPWMQESGYTVFAAFDQETAYFGNREKQWMINFRIRDLDGLVRELRASGIDVSDPEQFPHGRFSRLADPEGNPIELWEPVEAT